ncbi:hypothetical protein GO491_02350 [Flavobacteriaceae bacterium Ap0902]|nr:hypothetical protein [Flavobacteriaceae bacterium Ap0902]
MRNFLAILFIFFSLFINAQEVWKNPNFREKTLVVKDSIVLDSLQILPENMVLRDLKGQKIPKDLYQIEHNILILKQLEADSIHISYYIHPNFKEIVTYPKDPSIIVSSASEMNALVLDNQDKEEVQIFEGLNSKGTLVRGLMFGNNQGSSVQSSLNLQLDGKLSENVGIQAFISDTNAPIEVDGYTQSLDQFERIYIELFTDQSKIRAGHIDLAQNLDYFGRFQRKVTGLKVSHAIKSEEHATVFEAAGSLSRGEYTRYEFTGNEGNQGPYRLAGNSNEAYVLIIAGSERVYRNGKLLEYGENKDYILDYSTGEIVFTEQHLVTANDRFIVEYQYTNRNYNRFTWVAGASHQSKKFRISGHIYTEADNKNNPINQNLTAEDLTILTNAGNNTDNLFADSAVPVAYQEDRVLYRRFITNGNYIYEYSTDPNDELYQVNFTYLGANKGDYILDNTGVNGRVFTYVAPENGILQGDYAPVNPLVAPERKQVISLASEYLIGEDGRMRLDVGLSNSDANLFSEIDDGENIGIGIKVGGYKDIKLGKFKVTPQIDYEYIQDKFDPIERLRTPEFARDFNLTTELAESDQHFLQSNMLFYVNDSILMNYGFDYLNQTNDYLGYRHRMNGLFMWKDYRMVANASYLTTTSDNLESEFARYNMSAARKVKKLTIETGINGESYLNQYFARDSLSSRWNELYASATMGDSLQRYVQFRTYHRTDDSTSLGVLKPYSKSWGAQIKSRIIQTDTHGLEILLDYRNVNYERALEDASFLNTRINWSKSFLKKGVNLNIHYGLSGNTEQQRAFAYAKVADGLGIYKWIDYNQDGVQQIDEFEVAEFTDEASYIRVYTNVVKALQTNQNKLGFNLSLNPAKFLEPDFWKRIQSRIVLNMGGNYLKNNQIAAWNPLEENEQMRSRNSNLYIKNDFNRGLNYRWHFTHEFKKQENINLIFTGMESLYSQENKLNLRYDINDFLQVELTQELQNIASESESFASRRYILDNQEWSPQLNINWNQHLKSTLAYIYRMNENQSGIEYLKSQQLNFSLMWDDANKTSLYANLDWIKNNFTGNQGSLVADRMMMGLKSGNNLVWNLNLKRNINNFMTLDLQYNGRSNENLSTIHSGNMQIRLNF